MKSFSRVSKLQIIYKLLSPLQNFSSLLYLVLETFNLYNSNAKGIGRFPYYESSRYVKVTFNLRKSLGFHHDNELSISNDFSTVSSPFQNANYLNFWDSKRDLAFRSFQNKTDIFTDFPCYERQPDMLLRDCLHGGRKILALGRF